MKIKVSNYIADFLAEQGVRDVFTVTGGGAMHLNDSFGHHPKLHCTYNHHEQASAIAAEAYARIHNRLPLVCVTTGPGGTNALTGVLGAYTDSVPMLVISGQVKYSTTARSTGLPLRAVGDQEFDITRAVESMTKYAVMVTDPLEIQYHLKKALFLAQNGRPGPVWLDIPGNVQAAVIDTDSLLDYDSAEDESKENPAPPSQEIIQTLIEKMRAAKRPVIYAGSALRSAGVHAEFLTLVEKLNIPVVTAWNSIDALYNDHPLYVGRPGNMGNRPGNFAVQNSDFILSLGCRLSIRQVGYNYDTWAREAFVAMVDVDANELKKPTLHVQLPIHANVRDVVRLLNEAVSAPLFTGEEWLARCRSWKEKYPVVLASYYEKDGLTNPYCLIEQLGKRLGEGEVIVVGNGTACVAGSHGFHMKKNQRFIINSGTASMGYDLPAAIGVSLAMDKAQVICITGDGSIQMNLQELQTILQAQLPIKLFLINNNGYHSIRQSQTAFFGPEVVGIGPDSHDLSFPDMEKLAWAYGYPFVRCSSNQELGDCVDKALKTPGAFICEVMTDTHQKFEPKSSSKQMPDGTIVSPPLEDLAPFLSREELAENMIIPMLE